MLLLSIHPIGQLAAIAVGVYAAYLGLQRTQSLHFGKATRFRRERHVVAGSIALISMLSGIAAGLIIVSRFMENPQLGLHGLIAKMLLPLLVFGVFSGFYLYLNPGKGKILNQLTNFWFEQMADLLPHHLLATRPEDFPAALAPHTSSSHVGLQA